MGEKCEGCRYWVGPLEEVGTEDYGRCRRYPPTTPSALLLRLLTQGRGAEAEFNHESAFPPVSAEEWCGEYAPRPTAS